jgi:hypothetical protein
MISLKMKRPFLLAISLALPSLSGCGASEDAGGAAMTSSAATDAASGAASGAAPTNESQTKTASGAPNGATAQLIQLASAVPRRIIYNATVDLVAPNFSRSQRDLLALIAKHGGYLAETNIGAAPGTPRQGSWKIRVPEPQFTAFMTAVTELGELQTTRTDSQDVTAEFTDLQARISNKAVEERRLIAHLQRSTAKLAEILQVERELSRVRGEIEQMQGRLRLLANQSALATVTVTLREVKGYVAPQPTTFNSEIARTFAASLGGLQELGKGLVLFFVSLLPWLPLILLVGIPVWRFARRQNAKLNERL